MGRRIVREESFDQWRQRYEQEQAYLASLKESVLTEEALRNLQITPSKKYSGPAREGTIGEGYGPRGVGKTKIAHAWAHAMTRGMDFGPFKTDNAPAILIVDGEMSLDLLKEQNEAFSRNLPPPLKPLDTISNEFLYHAGNPIIRLSDQGWRNAFIELVKEGSWDMIAFDNLAAFLPGEEENDISAWGPIGAFFLELRWLGRAVLFLHHAGKSGDQRGTSGREDALDYVLKLTYPPGYQPSMGCSLDATLTKCRRHIGAEAAPFHFEILSHPSGGLTWKTSPKKEKKKELIIALLGNGKPQGDVPEIVGVDKGYVSRVRSDAIKEGILRSSGEFTVAGRPQGASR